jgi:hypothetical protein
MAALIGMLGASAPAAAAWMNHTEEDPFGGDTHIAVNAVAPGYMLGFRCKSADELSLILLTPEKSDDDTAQGLDLMKPKLLVIVDTAPKQEFPVRVGTSVSGDDLLMFTVVDADSVAKLLGEVMAAKRRVAVAVDWLGKTFHSKSFDVDGSKRALGTLAKACGVTPPS